MADAAGQENPAPRSSEEARKGGGEATGLNAFLQPHSMLTPGILGALVMAISGTLYVNFGWDRAVLMLVLSAVAGILVLVQGKMSWLKKAAFYVLNSLFIFCVAAGANVTGSTVTTSSADRVALESRRIPQPMPAPTPRPERPPARTFFGPLR